MVSSFGGPFDNFSGMSVVINFIPIAIFIVFAIVIVSFIVVGVKGAAQWGKNNAAPVLTVAAKIVVKRANTSMHSQHHQNGGMMGSTTSSTTYYVTFEVESGDRMELSVPDSEYGMLAEGDSGSLTFQGTRYKGFVRSL